MSEQLRIHRGYETTRTRLELLNAIRSGARLRWLPGHMFGRPEKFGRGLFLNGERLSTGDEFLVVDMTAEKQLWAREDHESDTCTYQILESNLPRELKGDAP